LLTSAAGYYLLSYKEHFENPALDTLKARARDLIDEKPIETDIASL
jgi:hypothetical protein